MSMVPISDCSSLVSTLEHLQHRMCDTSIGVLPLSAPCWVSMLLSQYEAECLSGLSVLSTHPCHRTLSSE